MRLPPTDLLELDSLLTDEQRAVRDVVRRFAQERVGRGELGETAARE